MLKKEIIYRELLYQALEKKIRVFTQKSMAVKFSFSLSTVNNALLPLRQMNAVQVNLKNFAVVDPKKLLYYWASVRNIEQDILYRTRVDLPPEKIEANMPDDIVFAAYSAYKFRFKDVPSDYSEIFVYGDESLKSRFPESKNPPNLFILKKDDFMHNYGKITTIAQTFVDLWNLKSWYAKEFLKKLEEKLNGILE